MVFLHSVQHPSNLHKMFSQKNRSETPLYDYSLVMLQKFSYTYLRSELGLICTLQSVYQCFRLVSGSTTLQVKQKLRGVAQAVPTNKMQGQ